MQKYFILELLLACRCSYVFTLNTVRHVNGENYLPGSNLNIVFSESY
jgi:hypothetical protein